MGGRAEPPEGTPEGGSGGEDEFRSVVFDESFVRAARIQELSAQERMSSGTRPVRRRGLRGGGLSRQALALMLLVSMAFAAAVYLGTKHPYTPLRGSAAELSISVIPLRAGSNGVPVLVRTVTDPSATASAASSATGSASAAAAGSASAAASATARPTPSASATTEIQPGDYPYGNTGLGLPPLGHTDNFSSPQVLQALKLVQSYLEASSLNPAVLTGGETDPVRNLLASGQYGQFDQSISKPADDRRHEITGWMVRFDPKQVELAQNQKIRAQGTMAFTEVATGTLELTSDYTFIYALEQTPSAIAAASASAAAAAATVQTRAGGLPAPHPTVLFTVRREITYRVTAADIDDGHLELSDSVTQAGATTCDADQSRYLQPVFPLPGSRSSAFVQGAVADPTASASPSPSASATTRAPGAGTDPFDQSRPAWQVCGVMTGPTP